MFELTSVSVSRFADLHMILEEGIGFVGKAVLYDAIRDAVAKHSLDIYCHTVKYHEERPIGLERIEGPHPEEEYKGQVISIIVKTGRGGSFTATEPCQSLANVWRGDGD